MKELTTDIIMSLGILVLIIVTALVIDKVFEYVRNEYGIGAILVCLIASMFGMVLYLVRTS